MMKETISVIVPVYNVELYLKDCVNSIVNQSYKNLEIILVDDGSKDLSGEICEELAMHDKRIKVFHKKNGGLSDARNYGLQEAKGEYVTFVDSDDCIHRDMLKIMIDILKKETADLAICSYKKVKNNVFVDKKVLNPVYRCVSGTECMECLEHVNLVISWGKLYKRTIFHDNNISFPVGKLHEDEFTTYKIIYGSNRCAIIDEQMYYYRIRKGSITNMYCKKRMDGIEGLYQAMTFFKNQSEKKIYSRYTIWVLNAMATNILGLKRNLRDEDCKILEELRMHYRKIYRENLAQISISNMEKAKIWLFCRNEWLYEKIQNLYEMIK